MAHSGLNSAVANYPHGLGVYTPDVAASQCQPEVDRAG